MCDIQENIYQGRLIGLNWYIDRELAAVAGLADQFQSTTMGCDDVASDGQTQPKSLGEATRLPAAIEGLEDLVLLLFNDARTMKRSSMV